MRHHPPSLAVVLTLAALVLAPSLAQAGSSGRRWWSPKLRSKQTADGADSSKSETKSADPAVDPEKPQPDPAPAGEKAAAPAPAAEPAPKAAPKPAPKPAASGAVPPAPVVAATTTTAAEDSTGETAQAVPEATAAHATPKPPPGPPLPDSSLQKVIVNLRVTAIGAEPTALAYLDLIAAGHATAEQVNDFATYVAKRGMPKLALAFQEYALQLKPEDATLWLNLGTIRATNRSFGAAATAFKKSIALDPTRALAHYNLGAVYDSQKNYDDAIEEYRRALVLDPDLADPRKNPQVVNNENLLAVKLQIYQAQAGSMGLPLLQMQKPVRAPAPAPATPPDNN